MSTYDDDDSELDLDDDELELTGLDDDEPSFEEDDFAE